jgi:hypothetical protein
LLIDLYRNITFRNLQINSNISITAVDEHSFSGYTLKGKAIIVDKSEIAGTVTQEWERRVIERISRRVLKNIKDAKTGKHHPEANFPQPQYLIQVDVEQIINLTPQGKLYQEER